MSMNDPRLEPGEGPRTRACGQPHCGKQSPEPLGASDLAVCVSPSPAAEAPGPARDASRTARPEEREGRPLFHSMHTQGGYQRRAGGTADCPTLRGFPQGGTAGGPEPREKHQGEASRRAEAARLGRPPTRRGSLPPPTPPQL